MTLLQKFFSFKGRLRRRDYWLCSLALGAATVAVVVPLMIYGLKISATDPRFAAAGLIFVWPSAAILAKRIQDRDKTGWMAANYWVPSLVSTGLSFIPDAGFAGFKVFLDIGVGMVALWYLVEFGFMDGTQGRNAYGPSPKGVEPSEKVADVFA
jgi:uncharacterized membrane protein YhaH (DUF805 family)